MIDILLVEDEKELAELMRTFLEREGYLVHHVVSGESAVSCVQQEKVKAMILDLMLPGMDGFAVCRKVRETQNLPILILSAKVAKEDKLSSYELGADDYMEKPVDVEILIAKVRAILQRSYEVQPEKKLLISGELTLDMESRTAYLHGEPLGLNVKEYELLSLFLHNPGKTLPKEYIFNQVWGMDSFSEEQTLTVHVKMLRAKIEEEQKNPRRLKTVWGVGYRYEEI